MIHSIPLNAITEADLQALVDNSVSEGRSLEYKQALPSNTDSDKKEFLADVSSLANAAGGDLIIGIVEDGGVATEIRGSQGADADGERLRLEQIIQTGIRPRIPALFIRSIPLVSGTAIIIRVRQSWVAPHIVNFKNHAKFYSRNSAGKYQLDVDDLRVAFLLSETRAERIRNFRADRLGKLIAGESPMPLKQGPKSVLHLVPVNAFEPGMRFDVANLAGQLQPMGVIGWDDRYNFDGILTFRKSPQEADVHTYVQVFHNGIIEAVDASLDVGQQDRCVIPADTCEQVILKALPAYLSVQQGLGAEPPVFIMLSLLEVRGCILGIPNHRRYRGSDPQTIDRNDLLISEVIASDFESDIATIMRPAFDAMWNAGGWPRSMSYDDAGQWRDNSR